MKVRIPLIMIWRSIRERDWIRSSSSHIPQNPYFQGRTETQKILTHRDYTWSTFHLCYLLAMFLLPPLFPLAFFFHSGTKPFRSRDPKFNLCSPVHFRWGLPTNHGSLGSHGNSLLSGENPKESYSTFHQNISLNESHDEVVDSSIMDEEGGGELKMFSLCPI